MQNSGHFVQVSMMHNVLEFDGLVQERCNSRPLAMELHDPPCTNPSR